MKVSSSTGFYEKAKQRMLNKMGRKTTLTRNEKVDYISPRLEEIKATRRDIARLFRTFRANYRQTLLTGTHLCVELMSAWSCEVGERKYVPEIDAFIREKSEEEMKIVQEASDDIRTVMEVVQQLSNKFDELLRVESNEAFGEFDGEMVEKLERVVHSREVYKAARTKYSDGMINFKLGTSSTVC